MTLKTNASELSERAKAFSVERLINTKQKEVLAEGEDQIIADGNGKFKAKHTTRLQTFNNITTELCSSDLWEKFSDVGTEMIITKAGRRMFPTLKIRFHGLSVSTTYIVYMDIIPVGETRYRYIYHSSKWVAAGNSETYLGNNLYIHPDSPATGQLWISQGHISFDKLKLTNNKRPIIKGQISLSSMHKYQPRMHILEVPVGDNLRLNSTREIMDYIHTNGARAATFAFKQTAFITVTAYQNQEITRLKIESNPFAKGFRISSKTRREKAGRLSSDFSFAQGIPERIQHQTDPMPNWTKDYEESLWCRKAQKIPLKLVIPPMDMRECNK